MLSGLWPLGLGWPGESWVSYSVRGRPLMRQVRAHEWGTRHQSGCPIFAAFFAAKVGWSGEGVPGLGECGRAFARCPP